MSRTCSLLLIQGIASALVGVGGAYAQPLPTPTTFTYQGQLKQSGVPVNATADFQFSLYDLPANLGGTQVGAVQTVSNVSVTGGLFTVSVDFGTAIFAGNPSRWLQVAVRSPSGSGAFTPMSTRQFITAAPFAIGLRLPNAESATSTGPLLTINNTGSGAAFQGSSVSGSAFIGSTTGSGYAFRGSSVSGSAFVGSTTGAGGVTFSSNSADGYGLIASDSGPNGVGVAAMHDSSSGTAPGLYALTNSTAANCAAILADQSNPGAGGNSSAVHAIGRSNQGRAIWGESLSTGVGVYGSSLGGEGIRGYGQDPTGTAIVGAHLSGPYGTIGEATVGASGHHQNGNVGSLGDSVAGVSGTASGTGLSTAGVQGRYAGSSNYGYLGSNNYGVFGNADGLIGVGGFSNTGIGIYGYSTQGIAIDASGASIGARIQSRSNTSNGLIVQIPFAVSSSTSTAGNLAIFENDQGVNFARIDRTGRGYFNGGTQTGGADLAEAVIVEGDSATYEPGDVLVIALDGDRTFARSAEPYCTRVAGVHATKPGVLLTNRHIDDPLEGTVPMGVVGIIPTKVSGENGPIRRGDLLVTASTPAHAMKGTDRDRMLGAVIGKAMQNFDGQGTGVIEVMVNVK